MKVCPDARELARRWFEEVWNARRDASKIVEGCDTWNLNGMLSALQAT